jgi:cytochrome c oxidase subunit 3
MIIGAGMLLVLIWHSHKGRYSADYYTPVDLGGLYWHFVDIIWIYLFPLLYLIDRHLSRQ